MIPQRINLLEGEWIDNSYRTILPYFAEIDIPIFRQVTAPLTHLYDENYWGILRHQDNHILLDPTHWYYNDDVFELYVKKISQSHSLSVCIGDPYNERPNQIELPCFEEKLFQRTRRLANIVKNAGNCKLLSPVIRADSDLQEQCLSYFIHNRAFFDVYNVYCDLHLDKKSTGILTSFLKSVLSILDKPVWVMRWAIPCYDERIVNSHILGSVAPYISSQKKACIEMVKIFETLTTLCNKNIKWFFTGLHKDAYNSLSKPVGKLRHFNLHEPWNHSHFTGIIDSQGNLKEEVFNTLVKLIQKYNDTTFR